MIRLLVPRLPVADALRPYIEGIDIRRQYSNMGPLAGQLEERLAKTTGAGHVACVANGTIGLELALRALRLPKGGGVALPTLTFPATAIAIIRAGLRPVFCDIDPETCLLSLPETAKSAARGEIVAAMPVALFGRAVNAASWGAFARDAAIPVIVDAAGAIGYQAFDPRLILAYSLHATKPLSSAEGGFVSAADPEFVRSVRCLANFGFANSNIGEAGTNGKLSEYHAAIGLASLDAWPQARNAYECLFAKFGLEFAARTPKDCRIVNHSGVCGQMVVCASRPVLQDDINRLASAGIETRRWFWPPLDRHAAFAEYAQDRDLAETTRVGDRLLGLPWHLDLDAADIAQIGSSVAEILR